MYIYLYVYHIVCACSVCACMYTLSCASRQLARSDFYSILCISYLCYTYAYGFVIWMESFRTQDFKGIPGCRVVPRTKHSLLPRPIPIITVLTPMMADQWPIRFPKAPSPPCQAGREAPRLPNQILIGKPFPTKQNSNCGAATRRKRMMVSICGNPLSHLIAIYQTGKIFFDFVQTNPIFCPFHELS